MIIKPTKDLYASAFLSLICTIGFFIVLFFEVGLSPVLLVPVLLIIVAIKYCIASLRTIELSKVGIQVSFLCFKKLYLWNDLATKRIVDLKHEHRIAYKRAVIFCKNKTRIFKRTPGIYNILVNSFNFVCIYFEVKNNHFRLYEVNETIFLEILNFWGVELEEIN